MRLFLELSWANTALMTWQKGLWPCTSYFRSPPLWLLSGQPHSLAMVLKGCATQNQHWLSKLAQLPRILCPNGLRLLPCPVWSSSPYLSTCDEIRLWPHVPWGPRKVWGAIAMSKVNGHAHYIVYILKTLVNTRENWYWEEKGANKWLHFSIC